jgi:4-hydroxybutyryl-CoA dehydratase/vinylacetyl-CoA-Delta-isomerase
MGLRSPEQYLEGLRDGREVYYRGERVEDVTEHAELGIAARHAALDFTLAEDPHFNELAVTKDEGESYSTYYRVPRSEDDLLKRSRLIETSTARAGTLVVLVKEIGTDAIFSLMRVLQRAGETAGLQKLEAFYRECRNRDLALATAQTDVKGDRAKSPAEQEDPDLYVRVVDRQTDGIIVRGAKVHTSCAPYVDEIVVLPSRRLRSGEEPWSVGFAVPVATPGLRLYASDFLHGESGSFTRPVSSQHKMIESLTVFDDVFVPWNRVFFHDRPDIASAAALAFVEFHRFTAISYKLPLLDAFVGSAIAVARANGIEHAGHVREKLTWLEGYAETVRGLTELAALRAQEEAGIAYPDVFTTNLAKWTFARDFHRAVEIVQDLAGGLLVTGLSDADWASPNVQPVLKKYFRGAWPAEQRLAVLNLISDLTARPFGGWQSVLAVHAEGSIEAEKLAMFRSYDSSRALSLVLQLAGIEDFAPPWRPM